MSIKDIFETMEYGPAPESDKEAIAFLESCQRKFKLFINGVWVQPASGQFLDTINPADGKLLASVAAANEKDVDAAVLAAKNAFQDWRSLDGHIRARYLYAMARQIQKHSRLFALLESLDNGKPVRETWDIDVPLVVRHFYHHAGWAQLSGTEMQGLEPLGVVGQIIPWNFPLLMLSWKIAPALAMGNTVVLKPAETTPLTALLFAEICREINLPPGVVNVVTGAGDTGAALVKHPDVAKIAFTGSTEVGKLIRRQTAGSGKKLSLELGGKSPFIVFEDADLDSVVEGVVDAIWFNQGQVCCAGSRLLVQESVAETLHAKLKQRMQTLRLGNPLDKGIDMGAINSSVQLQTIERLVKLGIEEGNEIWQPNVNIPQGGCFFPPTLFTNVSPTSVICQEEIFGPVLVSMTFRSHAEAIKLANNTRYGLAASIWTENINLALDVAPQIKAGTVWINCTNVFDAASGFGGYRESGFGREGGREGLLEYAKPVHQHFSFYPILPSSDQPKTQSSYGLGPGIDRTYKLYIGGKQVRPDGGYSIRIVDCNGVAMGEVPAGNRKDIRNAVEAAHGCSQWANMTGHARSQILYYIAENLYQRRDEFALSLTRATGQTMEDALTEVDISISRLYTYGAWADKYDGRVHSTVQRYVTMAMHERLGVMAVICPSERPLLSFISTVIPALCMGNCVVAVPSEVYPTLALELYQILETSDLPGGSLNIITGDVQDLTKELAGHADVDGIWYFGSREGAIQVETLSADNLKRTWVHEDQYRDWLDAGQGEGIEFLQHATEVKNIWIPYGA